MSAPPTEEEPIADRSITAGVPLYLCEAGPHKGRVYMVRPDGSLGRRVYIADPATVKPWVTP